MVTTQRPQLARAADAAPPRILIQILQETAKRFPDSSALDDGRTSLSYGELLRDVRAYGRRLHQAGIGAGDKVGVRIPSGTNELYLAILAILYVGAAYVPAWCSKRPASPGSCVPLRSSPPRSGSGPSRLPGRQHRQMINRHRDTADERARRRMDSRFHVAISIASQSSRLTSAALQLEAELMTLWWGIPGHSGSESVLVDQHKAIVDAIRDRDADAAARAAEHHSRSEMEFLIEQHLRLTMRPEEGA
ncbi:hypothetical protein ASG92_22910 [Arthrobacter sp. Soil736]|nr:hypothetical protein ASG92_22910 [Arthrobacter sp. Soil736]